ncbi:protein OSCP1 isoform X2 [Anguilla rostrata]|uniref:protein OSCP1 isoform X2 n=1 Tax=Anguilla rostrata TaxID=7938 RepID=UPI0030D1452C
MYRQLIEVGHPETYRQLIEVGHPEAYLQLIEVGHPETYRQLIEVGHPETYRQLIEVGHPETYRQLIEVGHPETYRQLIEVGHPETYRQLIEMYTPLSGGEFQLIRQTLLVFFQDMHIRVSIFLKDKVQNSNGRFVLPTSGPVPHGTQVPGSIRIFSCAGEEVKRLQFPNGGSYSSALREGSFELFGERVIKLGTNMYSVSRPVETHMSGTAKNSAQHTKVNAAPNPLAKEELNLLARLMGGLDVQKPTAADSGFRVNLFSTDEEEEEALISRPEELSYEVINIQATKDQQANEELARIMGEFTEEAEPSQGPSDKGADLLAMMDGL